ncbi:MAG: SRPBCC domain-containing protein [Acidimicrobiia bacterium]|nr:SRPBCC domain-containing protein [Acidimicrobiia bacterium]
MGVRSYRATRNIDAPSSTVWALLVDAGSYADWNRAVISIQGKIEEGGSIELVSIANPKRTFKLEVTEMTAPHRMVWSDGMPLGLFRGRRTYTIADRDQCSEFTMVEEFTGPLAGLITKAIPDLTDSFTAFADSIQVAAESRARAERPPSRSSDPVPPAE